MNELSYLDVLKNILEHGEERHARNATTLSTFGVPLQFDIRNSFPLLTSKRVYWKGVLHELLWFIKGDTNACHLMSNNVHIWDGNTSRDYLDNIGLSNYSVGECGPIYGFQWRHYNALYNGPDHNYNGQGIDQLQNCIDLINHNPTSRRIFMSAWNPEQLDQMCLPPCHVSYQFYVHNNNELSCNMYQRSGDMFLGVPFNIASTACLVYMIAHLTNKTPGKILITIGDAHIYKSHIPSVCKQLENSEHLYDFPKLHIKSRGQTRIDEYVFDDFEIQDYTCHPTIYTSMIA